MTYVLILFFCFFYLLFCSPTGNFLPLLENNLTHLMLITTFFKCQPKCYWEPCIEVKSISLAKHLVGLEMGTFQFLSQCLNSLGTLPKYIYCTDCNIVTAIILWAVPCFVVTFNDFVIFFLVSLNSFDMLFF